MKIFAAVLCLVLPLLGHAAEGPAAPCPEAARAESAGFEPAALCALLADFAGTTTNFHALLIERHGVLVAQAYKRGKDASIYTLFASTRDVDERAQHDVRSISKSITSLLWGIADGQGRMPALATPVLDLLPAQSRYRTQGRETITIEHLFNMSSGLAWQEMGNYGGSNDEFGLYWRSSQANYVFDRPLAHPPGTVFNYNGGSTAILAQLLTERVGMSLPDYARTQLFEPLGITDWEWLSDLRGRPLSFAGLRMRPADLAKIGRLVLQQGSWQGRQIVPAAWIAKTMQPRIATGDGLEYGYQWWSGKVDALGTTHSWHGGIGNGGQRLFMVPTLDLVVVINAGDYNQREIGRSGRVLFDSIAKAIKQK